MIRFVLMALAMLVAPAASAQSLPAAYQVTGVAPDDVLNIRAEPSASAPVLGTIGPYAITVEVLRLSDDGKWGLVPMPEGGGWVSMRYLTGMAGQDPALIPRPFTCIGTEPFWNLALTARGAAEWTTPEEPRSDLTLIEEQAAPSGYHARLEQGPTRSFDLIVSREWCSDGMSDRTFGFAAKLFIAAPDGNLLASGCCTLDHR